MDISLYHEQTGQYTPEQEKPQEVDVSILQMELEWKQHPITNKLFKELGAEVTQLIDEAITLATTYPQHNNHQQIIDRLVRAAELRKVKTKYATGK